MTYCKRRARWLFPILAALVICSLFLCGVALLPEEQLVNTGEQVRLHLVFPANVLARLGWWQADGQENWPVATKPGQLSLRLRLLGLIPLKTVLVQVVEPPQVIPGGQSIGVLLKTSGAVVVGFAPVTTDKGKTVFPAREAGLLLGDTITSVNDQEVTSDEQVAQVIDQQGRSGGKLKLTIKRDGEQRNFLVQPILCRRTGTYRIGLYIRDSAAGVGTLTFYLPEEKAFGALGHMVVDGNGGYPVPLADGRIVEAAVQGIQPGKRGQPGEKIGVFIDQGRLTGSITRNTTCGIFGILDNLPAASLYNSPIPVALAHQVQPGPAEILTVVNGEQVERFSIYIERVMPRQRNDGKGMIIRVDDPRLLSLTGGIIQGMSGSPIIKDNVLVGAVTHVFVQDPTRGYGVLAEWMLADTGFFGNQGVEKLKSLSIGCL